MKIISIAVKLETRHEEHINCGKIGNMIYSYFGRANRLLVKRNRNDGLSYSSEPLKKELIN
jgi:hypothetical protein